jgi:hypothetical protein
MQHESSAITDHFASAVMSPLQSLSVGDGWLSTGQRERVCLRGVLP